ncbi:hypothetical protein PABG_05020 [Paracoccidioides brasiliensis Pb03]|nr:hypothetical protein PABG_05020 [Paracoccidioides brasiliensis Pb03]ODH53192.1 hypothetical protein GX48_00728 [Paracoccidioides brasiliensis]
MFKRVVFTTVTPLPPHIPRDIVISTLHAHSEIIELNPLVVSHKRCKAPPNAPPDEFHCIWYELTDNIQYLPGGIIKGNITYKACFHDLPRGLQTHIYAPTGLDIRNRWSVNGNMPGEPREPVELGLPNVPREGLYLREDVDMRCNIFAAGFVRKTLKEAHAVLVERLVVKADLLKGKREETIYEKAYPALALQLHSLYSNQVYSGEAPYTPCITLPPSPVSPTTLSAGSTPTRFPSTVHPSGSKTDPNMHNYVGGPMHYLTTPHTCCNHCPICPSRAEGGSDQTVPIPQAAEMDSTECQPAQAKAYAAKRAAVRFTLTPPPPSPSSQSHIYELE